MRAHRKSAIATVAALISVVVFAALVTIGGPWPAEASPTRAGHQTYRKRARVAIGEMGLTRTDLRTLKRTGVVFDGKRDRFRFKRRAADRWVSVGDGVKISRDGAYRYHPAREVNGGSLPAFIERIGGAAKIVSRTLATSTLRKYIGTALREQASRNHYLGNQKKQVRVYDLQLEPNRQQYSNGAVRVGWRATVKAPDGTSYKATGFVDRTRLTEGPRGIKRVTISSGTPAFAVN